MSIYTYPYILHNHTENNSPPHTPPPKNKKNKKQHTHIGTEKWKQHFNCTLMDGGGGWECKTEGGIQKEEITKTEDKETA